MNLINIKSTLLFISCFFINYQFAMAQCGPVSGASSAGGGITSGGSGGEATHVVGASLSGTCASGGCSLIYMIRADGPTTAYSSQSSNPNQTISLSVAGTYTIKSCVKASGGTGWCEATIGSVTVDPPCFTPTDISGPTSADIGDTQSFTASNSGGTTMFSWAVTGGTLSSTTGPTVSVTWTTAGYQTLTVTKTDPSCPGSTDTDTHNVDVTDTSCIELVATGGACGTPPANPSFGIQTLNPGATYSWTASGGSPSSGTGTSFSTSYSMEGTYQICVTAMGGNEPWCGPTTDCRNYIVDPSCGSGGGGGNSATCPIPFGISGPTTIDAGATGVYTPSPDQSGAPQYFTLTWNASGATGSNGSFSWANPGTYNVCATFSEPGCPDEMACKVVEVVQPCPGFTLEVNGSYTCGAPTGNVGAVPSGHMNPITFLWSNGSTASALSNVPTGNYTVTVTDATGCSVSGGYNLGGDCMPCGLDVELDGPSCVCTQLNQEVCETVQITTNFDPSIIVGYNLFSVAQAGDPVPSSIEHNGGGNFTVCFDTPGLHQLTGFASASNGCTDTDNIYIDVKTFFMELGPHVVCPGETKEVTVATKQSGTFYYSWSNGQTTKTADLGAGLHCVTVTNFDPNGSGGGNDDGGGGTKPKQDCEVELCVEVEEENFEIYCEGLNPHCQMGDGSISIFIEPIGGDLKNSTFTYLWSTGQTTDQIRGLEAGDYSVTVTTFNGCSKSCSITLVDEPGVEASISATSGCEGEDINLTSSLSVPGATVEYFWSGPNGFMSSLPNPTISNATMADEGTYILYIEDQNECTHISSIDVTLTSAPSLVIDNMQCSPDLSSYTITFTSDAAVTVPGYTVIGNTVPNIPAGTDVTLTAGVSPCSTTLMVMAPDCSCPMVNPPFDPINQKICIGEAIPEIAASSDVGTTISWYDAPMGGNLLLAGSNTFTPNLMSPVTAGVYTFYAEAVDGLTGCTSSTRLAVTLTVVELPVVTNVETTDETCENMNGEITISFDDNPTMMGIMFSIDGGVTFPYSSADDAGSYTIVNLDAGNYDLFVQWMSMECPVDVPDAFIADLTSPTVTVSNDGPDCEGLAITLSATIDGGTGPFNYAWSGPNGFSSTDTNPVITDMTTMANGTYTLMITDANDCMAMATTTVEYYASPTIAITNDGPACHDEDVNVTVTVTGGVSPFMYTWSGPNGFTNSSSSFTLNNVTFEDTGDYTVVVEDANGCTYEAITNVHVTEENTFTYTTSCDIGSGTYTVFINAMYGDGINHTTGTLSGAYPDWEVEVSIGTDVTITSTNSMTMCDSDPVMVSAPDCNCPAVTPTLLGAERCGPGEIELQVTSSDINCDEVRWYDAASGGTLLYTGLNYIETYNMTTTVYAACYNAVEDCESNRAMVTATVNPIPSVISSTPACSADNSTYSLTLETQNVSTISVDAGLTLSGSGDSWTISGIPAGSGTSFTIESAAGCTDVIIQLPVMCDCVATPPTLVGAERCGAGEITLTGSGDANCDEINWYADASATMLLGSGTSFTDSYNATTTVYAVCYHTATDCESDAVMVTATVNPLPIVEPSSNGPVCVGENLVIEAEPSGGTLPYTFSWLLADGSTSTDETLDFPSASLSLTGTYAVTVIDANLCENTGEIIVVVDECACPALPPTGTGDSICGPGQVNLTATGDNNCDELRWYDLATGGMLLSVGDVFTPTVANTTSFWVECYNATDNCSSARVEVIAEVGNEVTIMASMPTCASDNMSYELNVMTTNATNLTTNHPSATVTGGPDSWMISGLTLNMDVEVTASNDLCDNVITESAPDCSQSCSINMPNILVGCDDNGTPENDDDTFSYRIFVTGNGVGTTFSIGGDFTELGLAYNTIHEFGPYPITGAMHDITITDDDDNTCLTTAMFDQPEPCSTPCVLEVNCGVIQHSECGADNGALTTSYVGTGAPFTFAWSNGATTEDIYDLAPGTYAVTVTNIYGCQDTCSATIIEGVTTVGANSENNPTCGNENGSVYVIEGVGTPPITYEWSNGESGLLIENLGPGTYTVTATDANDCTAEASTILINLGDFEPSCHILENVACDAEGSAYVVGPTGKGANNTYIWSNGETTDTIYNLTPGTYSVTVTNQYGCMESCEVTLDPPNNCECPASPPNVAPESICGQGEVTLSATGGADCDEIRWYTDATSNTIVATGSSYTATYSSTSTVYVSCYNTNDDCESDRAMVTVDVYPLPTIIIESTECSGSSYTINATVTNVNTAEVNDPNAIINMVGNQLTITNITLGGDLEITITSSDNCEEILIVSSPDCCPLEPMNVPAFCNRGADLTNTVDDFLQFALNLDGPNGGSYTLSGGGVSPVSGAYNTAVTFSLPVGSPGAGDVSINIVDDNDQTCNAILIIIDPGICPTDCPSSNCFDIKVTKN